MTAELGVTRTSVLSRSPGRNDLAGRWMGASQAETAAIQRALRKVVEDAEIETALHALARQPSPIPTSSSSWSTGDRRALSLGDPAHMLRGRGLK
jgi:hypothetical protein